MEMKHEMSFLNMARAMLLALSVLAVDGASGDVTLGTLLREMADPDAVTYLPERPWTTQMWSSHDRASIAPGRPGWFANDDRNKYVRDEKNAAGKIEHVMLDAKGPGAIVRFWMTFASVPGGGILRFYVDGEKVVEGSGYDILSGEGLCGSPLAASVPGTIDAGHRGHDLYLPIPYARSCKVTIEHAEIESHAVYYNVETRTYPAGTKVEGFTRDSLAKYRTELGLAKNAISAWIDFPLPNDIETKCITNLTLNANEERSLEFAGPGAIREIVLDCDFGRWTTNQLMPDEVMLVADCDGERTIEVPAVEFFGTGPSLREFNSRFCAKQKGLMRGRWVMPFRKSARVAVCAGNGRIPIRGFFVKTGGYEWKEGRSLHFRCSRTPYRQFRTREKGDHRDLNYLSVKGGPGRLVGCGVYILNPAVIWWGEGDEKIYVDGERTPSYIGTGTEDHYGYAWCRGEVFSHPFLAQPDGRGNMSPGPSVNLRHRVLDAVEFRNALVFDMELWHWRECLVDYDAWCWYYFR